ncbi:hypothetical protein BGZ75_004095 [Mortierella antarctica]|nr:hypothetical protein BGZ75_004095 [Mortierella antarctica]
MQLLVDSALAHTPALKLPFAARSPFMLPELDRLIASHLDRTTLASAARVCKLWHSIFNPVLWKRLSLKHVADDDDRDDEFNFISRRTPPASSLPSLPSSCSSTWSSLSAEYDSNLSSSHAASTAPLYAAPFSSLTLLQQAFLHTSRNKVLKGLIRYGHLVQELLATGITDQELPLIAVLCPSLRVLELEGGRYTVESLTELFQKRKASIQIVRFKHCVQLRDIFQSLAHLENLREFELYGSCVGNTINSPNFFEHDLFPVLRRCPRLRSLVIEQVYIIDQNIVQGEDEGGGGGDDALIGNAMVMIPPLTTSATAPVLSSTSILSAQLRSSRLGTVPHYATLPLRPGSSSLKSLVLDCGDIPDSVIMALLKRCPLLEQLSLDWSRELTDASLRSFQYICPNITEISLSRCAQLSTEGFQTLLKSYPGLISLDLNGNILSDLVLEELSRTCQFLQHLSINACQNVTDLGVQAVLMNCSRLKYFSMRQVAGLSSLLFDDIMMPSNNSSILYPVLELASSLPSYLSASLDSIVEEFTGGSSLPSSTTTAGLFGSSRRLVTPRPWACRWTLQSLLLPELVLPSRAVIERFQRQQALLSRGTEPWEQPSGDLLIQTRLQQIDTLKHLTLGGHNLDLRVVLDGLHRPRELENLRITKLKRAITWADAQWLIETAAPRLKRLAVPVFGNRNVTDWIEDQRPGLLSSEKYW